ncbi:MAG TPA: GDP-mannose 4,6-dehydratase [Longimicrobiaceae bacterium]|nr:GDP-mannose 4,6-dehydratase [Longimicrobiaceae bacterium]
MRILVTGASGFVGQHLLRELLSSGDHELIGGTLTGPPTASATLTAEEIARVKWVELDVASTSSVSAVVSSVRPERVYHLAGQSSVSRSFAAPLETWDVNGTGTLRVLNALQQLNDPTIRMLLISSAEVYGAVPAEIQPINERSPLAPTTPYGVSKAAAELASLQSSAAGALQVVVARSFNHTGPGQDERFALPGMAGQLRRIQDGEMEAVLRVGNLHAKRDFLDVRDVVRAYITLMEQGDDGGVYNVCAGEAADLAALVERLVVLSGTGARIEVDPERFRDVDVPLLVGDPSRLRTLGWLPQIPLDETLRDLLRSIGITPVEGTVATNLTSGDRPLFGKRVVVTRARAQAAGFSESLRKMGAEVIPFPTIRITDPTDPEPLHRAVADADGYDWIIFTSVNGVERFWQELSASGRDTRVLAGVSLCAIGPATAEAIEMHGARADIVPDEYVAEAVIEALSAETTLWGSRILIPRAEVARSVLPTSLRESGAEVVDVAAYRTVPDGPDADEVRRRLLAGEVDLITFTASSTVRNYVDILGAETGDALVASIGPITSRTARELGLSVDIEAAEYSIPGLIEAIRRFYEG